MSEIFSVLPFSSPAVGNTYILLISPDQIPHVAIVHRMKYYSLANFGLISGEDFGPYLKALKRLKKGLIFLDLGELETSPENGFRKYDKAVAGGPTCLAPIKDFVHPESKAQFAFEFVPELYAAGKIIAASQLNFSDKIDDKGNFRMSVYSHSDIDQYIHSINEENARRKQDISPQG